MEKNVNGNVSERKKHTRGEIAVMICFALATCLGMTLLVEHVIGTHAWAGGQTEPYEIEETLVVNSDGSFCYYRKEKVGYKPKKDGYGNILEWIRTVKEVLETWWENCASLPGVDDGEKIAMASSMMRPETPADFYIPLGSAA